MKLYTDQSEGLIDSFNCCNLSIGGYNSTAVSMIPKIPTQNIMSKKLPLILISGSSLRC
jgi:hypothetical protein